MQLNSKSRQDEGSDIACLGLVLLVLYNRYNRHNRHNRNVLIVIIPTLYSLYKVSASFALTPVFSPEMHMTLLDT